MIRDSMLRDINPNGLPRMRGDDPDIFIAVDVAHVFAPHARG